MTQPPEQQPGPYGQQPLPGYGAAQPGPPYTQQNPYGEPQPGYPMQPGYPPFGQAPGMPGYSPGEPPKKKRTGLIFGVVAAVVIIAVVIGVGGFVWPGFFTSGSSGSPTSTQAANPSLGDATTLDPCSVIDAHSLASVAEIQTSNQKPALFSQVQSFSTCVITLIPKDASQSAAQVQLYLNFDKVLTPQDLSQENPVTQGKFKVVKPQLIQNNSQCLGVVVLPDNTTVVAATSASSQSQSQPTTDDLCNVAGAATTAIMSAINGNMLKHLNYPQNSTARLDTCSALTAQALTSAVPGISTQPEASTGKHSCTWGGSNDPVSISFTADLAEAPGTPASDSGIETVNIAGRPTYVLAQQGQQGPGQCSVFTNGAALNPWPGITIDATTQAAPQNVVEQPTIMVTGESTSVTTDQLCQIGETLANQAWTHLPPAS